jgi:CubicO group peptidase (beta-lactamase class C family)
MEERFDRLVPLIEDAMRRQRVPGLSIAVVQGGLVRFARGFGVTDLDAPHPVTPDTAFPCASISKTFVATALVRLEEEGALDLGARVVDLLPCFRPLDPRARAITCLDLLRHTSGLPDLDPLGVWDDPRRDARALPAYVESLRDVRLRSEPGREQHYSSMGFEILGAVIEEVTREPFEGALDRLVLAPLSMRASTFRERARGPSVARGHVASREGEIVPTGVVPFSRSHLASGTLSSSALDMTRWIVANLRGGELDGARVVSAHAHARMLARAASTDRADGAGMGAGWHLRGHGGVAIFGHGGWDVGFRAGLSIAPELGFGVVVLNNFHWSATLEIVNAALDVALGREPGPLFGDAPGGDAPRELELEGRPVRLERAAGDWILHDAGERRRLFPLGGHVFVTSEPAGREAIMFDGAALTVRRFGAG